MFHNWNGLPEGGNLAIEQGRARYATDGWLYPWGNEQNPAARDLGTPTSELAVVHRLPADTEGVGPAAVAGVSGGVVAVRNRLQPTACSSPTTANGDEGGVGGLPPHDNAVHGPRPDAQEGSCLCRDGRSVDHQVRPSIRT